MARATSSTTMTITGRLVKLGGASPHRHLAESGVPHGQAREDRAVVECVHDHLHVGCRSCHCGGTIPYRTDRGQALIDGLAEGASTRGLGTESTGPVAGLLVCADRKRGRNTRAPPTRQTPMTHGTQFVSPSRRSSRETAWSVSLGGILAGVTGGRNDSWLPEAVQEVVLLALPFGSSAGAPACHLFWILNFLRNSFHWRTVLAPLPSPGSPCCFATSSPPSCTLTGQQCPNWQCFKVVSAAVNSAKNML